MACVRQHANPDGALSEQMKGQRLHDVGARLDLELRQRLVRAERARRAERAAALAAGVRRRD